MFKKNKTPNYLKKISIILAAILLVLLPSAIYLSGKNSTLAINSSPPAGQTNNQANVISKNLITLVQAETADQPQINNDSPVLGSVDAPITIFEYSSFSCAYSAQIQKTVKDIMDKYAGKIKLIWKDMPLDSSNVIAHEAARCAQKQNKFWPYYDKLWEAKGNFNLDNLKNIAGGLGLNLTNFNNCLKNHETINLVNHDLKEADDLLIPGSPHFYINQQEFTGLINFADFEQAINAELLRPKTK